MLGGKSLTSYLWVQVWVNLWPRFEFCQLENIILSIIWLKNKDLHQCSNGNYINIDFDI